MSTPRIKFEQAVAKEKWQDAFLNLNALGMSDMLSTLSKLTKAKLDALIARRFAYKGGVNMPRMEYAWTVVKTKELPLVAPGDLLTTGQVGTAAQFLKKPISNTRISLNIHVFTDSTVKNRSLFPELVNKASDVLRSQGDRFKLDVKMHYKDINLQEVVYLSSQLEEMLDLIKKATTLSSSRLIVLLVRVKPNIGVHGLAAEINGKKVVVIDTDSPNPDRATLLHEIGHCAGLPHAGDATGKPVDVGGVTNIMAEPVAGVIRDKLTVTQGEYLARAFFASK